MTAPALLTPMAGDLGRVAAPGEGGAFDDVRLALVDALLAAKREGELGHEAWQQAYDHAARSLRMRVIEIAERAMRDAAALSRYPARRLAGLLPDAETADALLHRLLAEGMPLERFEGLPDDAATRRGRALALEVAWEGATQVATSESVRWRMRAAEVARWQRSKRPLWIISGTVLAIALLLAGWLGGQLPAPGWFAPVSRFWWGLPWP